MTLRGLSDIKEVLSDQEVDEERKDIDQTEEVRSDFEEGTTDQSDQQNHLSQKQAVTAAID